MVKEADERTRETVFTSEGAGGSMGTKASAILAEALSVQYMACPRGSVRPCVLGRHIHEGYENMQTTFEVQMLRKNLLKFG